MTTPTEHNSREYQAFLRGPVETDTFAFGTVEAYRGSRWHAPRLTIFPAPSDGLDGDFGIIGGGGFTVEIVDEAGTADWYVTQEDGHSKILLEDGSGAVIQEY